MLGAIALAGGALVSMFWFIVCVEFDSFIFRLVLSDLVLLLFWLTLFVCTFDSDLLSFLFTFVLLLVDVDVFTFVFVLSVELV